MTQPMAAVEAAMRSALCGAMSVEAVPLGYFVETGFKLPDGDLLSFYVIAGDDGRYAIEDDGDTLPTAIAIGFDIKSPSREACLRSILEQEGASYDDSLVIRMEDIAAADLGRASLRFISALIRMRDLFLVDRDVVARAFSEDVGAALRKALPTEFEIDDTTARKSVDADIIIRNAATGLISARVYAAGSDLRLMDAALSWQNSNPDDSPVLAVVDRRARRVSDTRLNRVTNLGMPLAHFDGESEDWVSRVVNLVANHPSRPIGSANSA